MSEEQLKAFLTLAAKDVELQQRINQATNVDDIATIANSMGYQFDASALIGFKSNLTDQELESVAGGRWEVDSYQSCQKQIAGYCNPADSYIQPCPTA